MAELYKGCCKPALLYPSKLHITFLNREKTWIQSALEADRSCLHCRYLSKRYLHFVNGLSTVACCLDVHVPLFNNIFNRYSRLKMPIAFKLVSKHQVMLIIESVSLMLLLFLFSSNRV